MHILRKILLLPALLVFACQAKDSQTGAQLNRSKAAAEYPDVINVTYVKAPLNVPLIVGRAKGIFEDHFAQSQHPQKVIFHDLTTGPQQIEALAAGSIDITSVLGATSALISVANDSDLRIISIFSRAPKTFVMQTIKSDIQSLSDLRGKKIVGPRGTILHQLLLAALEKEGLSINDIEFISMGLPEALAAMVAGHADVALLAGGAMVHGLRAGAKILTTGEGLVEGTTVTATRQQLIDKYPQMISTYFDAHKNSMKAMVDEWDESLLISAKELGLSAQEINAIIGLYDFDMTIKPTDIQELEKTQEFLFKTGLIQKKIDIEAILIHRDGEHYHPWNVPHNHGKEGEHTDNH
ncbi:MAG: ABC transporter substrate-binding protein [Spirochaetia bacterium]